MTELDYRTKCLAQQINACVGCGTAGDLVVHHRDADRANNDLENLVPLCQTCHGKVHNGKELKGRLAELQEELPERSKDTLKAAGPNKVDVTGRFRLPGHLHEDYTGKFLAAYEPEPGKIVLEPVENLVDGPEGVEL